MGVGLHGGSMRVCLLGLSIWAIVLFLSPGPQKASMLCGEIFLRSPESVDTNILIIFFVLPRPLFCSLTNNENTEAGWIKIAEGVAASKSLQNLK